MSEISILRDYARMCESTSVCTECEIGKFIGNFLECSKFIANNTEKVVQIIAKWAAEHPVKTRQSEFLKMFPNAKMLNGVISVDPCEVDIENCGVDSESEWCQKCDSCESCHKDYWLAEVE